MTDLELTKRCAEAMGLEVRDEGPNHLTYLRGGRFWVTYNPLTDNEQCFALVKRFGVCVGKLPEAEGGGWEALIYGENSNWKFGKQDEDLNRAVVGCVATMPRQGSQP